MFLLFLWLFFSWIVYRLNDQDKSNNVPIRLHFYKLQRLPYGLIPSRVIKPFLYTLVCFKQSLVFFLSLTHIFLFPMWWVKHQVNHITFGTWISFLASEFQVFLENWSACKKRRLNELWLWGEGEDQQRADVHVFTSPSSQRQPSAPRMDCGHPISTARQTPSQRTTRTRQTCLLGRKWLFQFNTE